MTASGTLRTTVKEAVPDVLGHGKTKRAPKDTSGTSSSTGGAIWSKPSAVREAAAALTLPTRRVTTVMTASGLLRTSV